MMCTYMYIYIYICIYSSGELWRAGSARPAPRLGRAPKGNERGATDSKAPSSY